jgi:hypothetical protein
MYTGSQLKVDLHNATPPHYMCKNNAENYPIWVEPSLLLPLYKDCLFYYLKVNYKDGTYTDNENVSVDVVNFGTTDALAYLDPSIKIPQIGYFEELILYLSKELGYTLNKDIRGAAFDWRLASDGLHQRGYYNKVQSLVEDTYISNGNISVTFITHSMGGPVILEFFNSMTQEWKDTYINKFIAMSPPFGGALSSVRAGISGDTLGVPLVPESFFLPVQRGAASGPWLFPQTGTNLWTSEEVLVETPNKKYSPSNWTELYLDLHDLDTLNIYEAVRDKTLKAFRAPRVHTFVIHGSGVKTDGKIIYSEDFEEGKVPSKPSEVISEDGDGTVSIRSLRRGLAWSSEHREAGYMLEYSDIVGSSHYGVLQNQEAFSQVLKLLNDPMYNKTPRTSVKEKTSFMAAQ